MGAERSFIPDIAQHAVELQVEEWLLHWVTLTNKQDHYPGSDRNNYQ